MDEGKKDTTEPVAGSSEILRAIKGLELKIDHQGEKRDAELFLVFAVGLISFGLAFWSVGNYPFQTLSFIIMGVISLGCWTFLTISSYRGFKKMKFDSLTRIAPLVIVSLVVILATLALLFQ